jgi:hypothetical protein
VHVGQVFADEYARLGEVADGIWSVYFGPVLLGRFDERDLRIYGAHNRNNPDRRRLTSPRAEDLFAAVRKC